MGKFRNGTTIHAKGYARVKAGPLRDQLVHRVVAAALIGRDLRKDEEVHHRDGNRLNFHFSNLMVLGSKDHGWVSAKQAWFMREKDKREKAEWDAFMSEEAAQFDRKVAEFRADGQPWESPHADGALEERWTQRG